MTDAEAAADRTRRSNEAAVGYMGQDDLGQSIADDDNFNFDFPTPLANDEKTWHIA